MKTKQHQPYTVFCRQANRDGTTWISTVWGTTPEKAAKLGVKVCAYEWMYPKKDIECYCVLVGDVEVALFED